MKQIAVMGLGTVGTGVVKVIEANQEQIKHKLGEPLAVKAVLDVRTPAGPYASLMTADSDALAADAEICVVVETIGGVGAALALTKKMLCAGKHVVTANKQLVAEYGHELLALAKEHGVSYLFEASVGGGIPILHPLTQCMAANRVDEIYGILNGTTNYILTKMVREGTSFADALSQAQEKGYAEANPAADVDGIDAGRKICILADLAFGRRTDPAQVPMEGISALELRDIAIAQKAGYQVKLLGRCLRLEHDRWTAYVAPHLIADDNPVAHVSDVFNAISVRGNATGEVVFTGKGAGELPTASACVADVMECLQEKPSRPEISWGADTNGFVDPKELRSRYYFRIPGTETEAEAALGPVQVLDTAVGTAFLTEPVSGDTAADAAAALHAAACLRVLGE